MRERANKKIQSKKERDTGKIKKERDKEKNKKNYLPWVKLDSLNAMTRLESEKINFLKNFHYAFYIYRTVLLLYILL